MRILDEKRSGSEIVAAEISESINKHINPDLDIAPGLLQKLERVSPLEVVVVDGLAQELVKTPHNNMGSNSPLPPYFVSPCEKMPSKKAKIDWLGFSSKAGTEAIRYTLQSIYPGMQISPSPVGMRGYPNCSALSVNGVQYGLMGWGAKHGVDAVSLTGVACKDFTETTIQIIYEFLTVLNARLTRIDLALDMFRGERTIEHALWSYEKGEFKSKAGGAVSPEKRVIQNTKQKQIKGPDWKEGDEPVFETINLGRTLYVGKRGQRLMGRIYEKGLEIFANMPEEYRLLSTDREDQLIKEGKATANVAETWLRLEAEYKHSKDRPLPLEMLLDRDAFFAGAYPYFASALPDADTRRPKALRTDAEVSLDRMIQNMRNAYGNTMYTLSEIGFTMDDIFSQVSTGQHNQKLIKSGVFSVAQAAADRAKWDFEGTAIEPSADCPF